VRIAQLETFSSFKFAKMDIGDRQPVAELFAAHHFAAVVHLAAQAGVRHSLIDPHAYAHANLTGFLNVLEGCRHAACRNLVYALSSSVYGNADGRGTLRSFSETRARQQKYLSPRQGCAGTAWSTIQT
jgi:nucleoside-diphosphate-sugar epimerase